MIAPLIAKFIFIFLFGGITSALLTSMFMSGYGWNSTRSRWTAIALASIMVISFSFGWMTT